MKSKMKTHGNMIKKHSYIKLILFISSFCFMGVAMALDTDKRGLNWGASTQIKDYQFLVGKYRAVIIGNNRYLDKNGVWNNLETAVKDAVAVAELLKNEYGFDDIVLLKDADRRAILSEFKKLSKRTEPNDNILVFYAGHGHLDDDEERGYWIPTDAQGFDDTTFIRNSTIRDEINIIADKTKHTLLLSDSCFSGSLLRGGNRGPNNYELSQGYYTKVGNKKSVQVLAAGGKEFVDDSYQNSGHSPFTYFLLNELKNNTQQFLSLSEVATNVIKAVANNVDQTPEAGVLAGAGDELGEFIFSRASLRNNPPAILDAKIPINKDLETESTAFLPGFRF